MITPDGWFDWAERVPGYMPTSSGDPNRRTNTGTNPIKGIFLHSAEGYEPFLRSNPPMPRYPGNLANSWHASNLFSGHLIQHYPLTVRCWHAGGTPNQSYVAIEHEGRAINGTIRPAQIDTSVRIIKEISEWKGWTPKRPASPTDISHTLWEHNEAPRIGGTSSACPSGRIPWTTILEALEPEEEDDMFSRHSVVATSYNDSDYATGNHELDARWHFNLPSGSGRVRFQVFLRNGVVHFYDGFSANEAEECRANVGGPTSTIVEAWMDDGKIKFWVEEAAHFEEIRSLGYYP